MGAIIVSYGVLVVAVLALGQAAMRICGAERWSWAAPAVGLSVLMLLAVPAIHVPGRATTIAVITAVVTVAALVWCLSSAAHRPPLADLTAGIPVVLLGFVPFASAGRAGTLGVQIDNDTAFHLLSAEAYRSAAAAAIAPLSDNYPYGPHAVVAVIAQGLGLRVDGPFAALTVATPLFIGWTALAVLRRTAWPGRVIAVSVVGMPFLIAAYVAEGAFKEPMMALVLLAAAVLVWQGGGGRGRLRWAPFGLLVAGAVSIYSLQGAVWPLMMLAFWALGLLFAKGVRGAWRTFLGELPALLIAAGVTIVTLVPQLPRILRFETAPVSGMALGNLLAPLPGWEVLGTWTTPDFRYQAGYSSGVWAGVVLVVALAGAALMWRTGRRLLVGAAVGAMGLWAYAVHVQTPYNAAKGLVIAAPVVLLLAVVPLVERDRGGPRWWAWAAPLIAALLFLRVADSSLQALRSANVAPSVHADELRSFLPVIEHHRTLFLGDDFYIRWELAGVNVPNSPDASYPHYAESPGKPGVGGQARDWDSVVPSDLNNYDYAITTRDAAASAPPPQMHLIRQTADFQLWQRVGTVGARGILPGEGDGPGAVLVCDTPVARAFVKQDGTALVRASPAVFPGPPITAGGKAVLPVKLSPGVYDIEFDYVGEHSLHVWVPGLLDGTLPANLDQPGPRYPVGRLTVAGKGVQTVMLHMSVGRTWLTPPGQGDAVIAIFATPVGTEHFVPLRDACGKYIDYYVVKPPSAR
jgi:hypothetical protein